MPNKWILHSRVLEGTKEMANNWVCKILYLVALLHTLTITYYVGASTYVLIKRENKSNSPKAKASISQLSLPLTLQAMQMLESAS